ncbi:MAG TPA: type IV pilin protein [Burkholderiales bacterium]|nr:type IV pilin protein [Burkholderiales bacterium]
MRRQSGFTLIEVMITIAIIAILTGIALPSYTNYIVRGKIQEATTALLAMRVKMEQYYQDNRTYPTGACVTSPTAPTATQIQVPPLKYSSITCPSPNANTYILQANGGVDAQGNVLDKTMVGLQLRINEANQRTTQTVPAGWNASGLPKSCWVAKTSGDC